ncbi:hypothetical protein ACFW9F_21830 [Streptomyces sp. NPDC059506]|uniref:hypothetical protein n=1 Tax=unclassified Streptomyces TaxID=2593676 RepID=UPI000CAD42AC|nr:MULTISPECIES: hypothetical protein [unclassified Streptomyces]MCZ2524991.1 hypothetical protein [Streptomyces sp. HB2AG]PLW74418.1 hypothetical protein C0036_01985 [Streptomyces sp. DJ]QMV24330.1 hypothetical protein GQS52_23990 [Streptomyces sp. SCUT-3]
MILSPAGRKRLTTTLVVVLCLAAGTLAGDRFLPFRGTGAPYHRACGRILSSFDMGFIPQNTLTGRRIITTEFEETGRGDDHWLGCTVFADGELQLHARVRVTTADKDTWLEETRRRELLLGRERPLDIVINRAPEGLEGKDYTALSGDSSAALRLPCRLPGGKNVHLSVTVTAPGASDGDSDEQRLTIAGIASLVASHSILKVGCLSPAPAPDDSPGFAS